MGWSWAPHAYHGGARLEQPEVVCAASALRSWTETDTRHAHDGRDALPAARSRLRSRAASRLRRRSPGGRPRHRERAAWALAVVTRGRRLGRRPHDVVVRGGAGHDRPARADPALGEPGLRARGRADARRTRWAPARRGVAWSDR